MKSYKYRLINLLIAVVFIASYAAGQSIGSPASTVTALGKFKIIKADTATSKPSYVYASSPDGTITRYNTDSLGGAGNEWDQAQFIIGATSESLMPGAENPDDGATTVELPFAVQPHSELITYQGVPVPRYPSDDFWYDVEYDSNSTVYTFRDPLYDGYSLNFQYALANSGGEGGGGEGVGTAGDADSLGGLPANAYERVSNKTTSLGSSNSLYPTQKAVNDGLATKQATLVSGTTIKTINGTSVLGSGDLVVSDAIDYSFQTLTDGATITLDGNNGINFKVTLGGNRTLAVSNIVVGKVYTIEVNQDATGNRHLTLPANSLVANGYGSGTSIILSTGALDKDQISFRYDGTNYLWTASLDYQ